jgi:hypothetical protein
MISFMKQAIATGLLIVLSAGAAFAGAWTAPKNSYYEKLAFNYYFANETFDKGGNRGATPNSGKFTDYNVSNYFEFGLTNDLTIINALTYKWLENSNDQGRTRGDGFGDVDLGVRYKLLDHEKIGIISTQALVKIPGAYGKNDPLPLGNGQVDAEFRLLYGRSLYPLIPGYANIEFGYRWRDGDPSDEVRYLIEFGVDITQKLYTRVKLDGIFSMDNGLKLDSSGNPTSTNNYDLGKLDLTLGYKIAPSWGVEASYVPALYGQNTAAGTTYSLAVYFKTP